jgi:hypothetical protein
MTFLCCAYSVVSCHCKLKVFVFLICQDELKFIGKVWLQYENTVNAQQLEQQISGMPNLVIGPACLACNQTMNQLIKNISLLLEDVYRQLSTGALDGLNMVAFKMQSNYFQQQMINMSNCMLEYQQLLDSVNAWLGTVSTTLSFSFDSLDLSSASNLHSTLQRGVINQLSAKSMFYVEPSLQPLLNFVRTVYDTPWSLDAVDYSVFSKLTSGIDNWETSLKDAYRNLFYKFSNISNYLHNTDKIVDEFMRRRIIWQFPHVNVESQQVGLRTAQRI